MNRIRIRYRVLVLLAGLAAWVVPPAVWSETAGISVERGRYLVKIAGCNDCHTAGYAHSGGDVPESEWLAGDDLGWRGPWGTTYAVNLRLYFQDMTRAQWLAVARGLRSRPPMPWFALRDMNDEDLGAIFDFARFLGPAGTPVPAYLAPGVQPSTPYVQFP